MKVTCVGGGPGSLFFATLMKLADPRHEVTVLERDPRGNTFGFGVVFSENTVGAIARADPALDQRLKGTGVGWTDIEMRHGGQRMRAGGNVFRAAARRGLLATLEDRALEQGANVVHGVDVASYEPLLEDNDVVVGGDGLNSGVRAHFAEPFRPRIAVSSAKYIWFATPRPFDALTFIFERSEHGWFGAHAYPFDESTSTFIVETDEATWQATGLDRTEGAALPPGESDPLAMKFVAGLFAETLDGHPLIANSSRWSSFRTVSCGSWSYENAVIIGDAAHTAHFSVGSGTKMAMEDAVALASSLNTESSVRQALIAYEEIRRPAVERIQQAAYPSITWWERFHRWMRFEPAQLFYHFMTRSQRVGHENLRMRDRTLTRRIEGWFADHHPQMDSSEGPLSAPLETPLLRLTNRLVVDVDLGAQSELDNDEALCAVVAPAWSGAGMVLVENRGGDEDLDWWGHVRTVIGRRASSLLAFTVSAEETADRLGHFGEFASHLADVLVLSDTDALCGFPELSVRAVRRTWHDRPLLLELTLPEMTVAEIEPELQTFAAQAAQAGVAGVILRCADDHPTPNAMCDRLIMADTVRNEIGLAVGLRGGVDSNEALVTAILGSRVDFGCGSPTLLSGAWKPRGAGKVRVA